MCGASFKDPIGGVSLRRTTFEDLEALFAFQSDAASNELAGTKSRTREAFLGAWERNFANPAIHACVIEVAGPRGLQVVGSVACFQAPSTESGGGDQNCVGYSIARTHWGRGVASAALAAFLRIEERRPLHATACAANAASRRVLEKCGFRCTGVRDGEETDRYLARRVAEFVLA